MAFTPKSPTTFKNVVTMIGTWALSVAPGQLIQQNLSTGAFESATTTTTQTQMLYRVINRNDGTLGTTALASSTPFDVELIGKGDDVFVVDTVNNSNAAHNGQRMIITSGGLTVTNTGTDVSGATGVFQQIGVVGAAADKKILAVRV
jgi:hypothetical protein